jgi:hypothetical protein
MRPLVADLRERDVGERGLRRALADDFGPGAQPLAELGEVAFDIGRDTEMDQR